MTNMQLPLSLQLDAELRHELMAGETISWQGQPDPRLMRSGYILWIFAIPWTAFSLGWTGIALAVYLSTFSSDMESARWWGWIGPLWGTPFIAVGCWMLWQPIKAARDARSTVHAVTNRRIITLVNGKTREVKSIPIQSSGTISCSEKKSGWGNISVVTGVRRDSDGDKVTETFDLQAIPDVAKVHRLLLDAQQRSGI
jgi:hypothetical protein